MTRSIPLSRWHGHGFSAETLNALLMAGVPQRFLRGLLESYPSPSAWKEAQLLENEDPLWRSVPPLGCTSAVSVLGTESYPWVFAALEHPPVLLYVDGDTSMIGPCVGVTGSRVVGDLARSVVSVSVTTVKELGAPLVSGGDAGVEEHVVREAVRCGVRVLLVPACSPDAASERLRELQRDVLSSGGAVLSQFPPETRESSYTVLARRRLLAALVYPLVVADAALASAAATLAGTVAASGSTLLVPVPPHRFREDVSSGALLAILSGDRAALGWGDGLRVGPDGFANGAPENGDDLREMLRIFWALRPCAPEDVLRRQ